jgi:hypothetical protein
MLTCVAFVDAQERSMTAGAAWYHSDRSTFLRNPLSAVVGQLASAAAEQGLHVESDQHEEWISSVGLLQTELAERMRAVELLRQALVAPDLSHYRDVILEYDFRRRGLRLDCVLLGDGIIAVIEFKRSSIVAADVDQVTGYCLNLVEFHEQTRHACTTGNCVVVPILALTQGRCGATPDGPKDFHNRPWAAVPRSPLRCDADTLHAALHSALRLRRGGHPVPCASWLASRFAPSSTILDAAISLYGQHDVSAIAAHAAPIELIARCTDEVAERIARSKEDGKNRIIFVSGAPGAGKTLVGLKLAFDPRFRDDAVFVTGNAPLVDVLTAALQSSYRSNRARRGETIAVASGYSRKDAHRVMRMSTFKIVKAHAFLGQRGSRTGSADGSVIIFDEAQRTYEQGREVLRRKLEADEAALILESLERSYPDRGSVVVALVGHKQAINRGEMGIVAWFKAAKSRGWLCAISDETLALGEVSGSGSWADAPNRERLQVGHLPHSLRYYRNGDIERWAELVLADASQEATQPIADQLAARGDTVWLVRDIAVAKSWAKLTRLGDEKAGIIASGQARRLAAEGLFVELKPDIAKWILAPTGDIRSSNMLETVQNQYQIQGLEIDYTIVCWDADLRREAGRWQAYKLSGPTWKRDKAIEVAKNGYRVLLTRARKGMMIFIPRGDASGVDPTRSPAIYDAISDHLLACGARPYVPDR